jgi:hypothetical protein
MNGMPPYYDSWSSVPDWLKSASQWRALGFLPKEGAIPAGRFVEPEIHSQLPAGYELLEEHGEIKLATKKTVFLFKHDQCVPYRAKPSTVAARKFFDIFAKHMKRDAWISKTDYKTKLETPSWYRCRSHKSGRGFEIGLDYAKVKSHVDQKEILGVIGHKKTRFVVIDLDLHNGSPEVFLSQAKVLLDLIHGKGGWHYQISVEKLNGIQFFKVFSEPVCIRKITKKIRDLLLGLDHEHADLARIAKQAGMKTIGNLEIYPTINGNGVRLPLCKDRVMVTDQVLGPTVGGKSKKTSSRRKSMDENLVGDVVRYVGWLEDPARKYVEVEKVIGLLELLLSGRKNSEKKSIAVNVGPKKVQKNSTDKTTPLISGISAKSKFISSLREFWIEGGKSNINKEFLTLYQLARLFGHTAEHSFNGIIGMLPNLNKATSQRLQQGYVHKLKKDLQRTAKNIEADLVRPQVFQDSFAILKRFLGAHPNFDPLDPETWIPNTKSKQKIVWSKDDREKLIDTLKPILKIKRNDDEIIIKIVNWIVRLVQIKKENRKGFGRAYLKVWGAKNFPTIKWGNDHKLSEFLNALHRLRVTYPIRVGNKGNTATVWGLGALAKGALENGAEGGSKSQNKL